jgi:tetratricopeptide (TPR) repeat protein
MGNHRSAKRQSLESTLGPLAADERDALSLALARASQDETIDADDLFCDAVEQVEQMFYRGELSAPDAADWLNLSLEEFVAEFVATAAWRASHGIQTDAELERVVSEAANILERERSGVSLRDFASEILSSEPTVTPDLAFAEALALLPAIPLGQALRRAQASGASLDHFVATSVFPPALRARLRAGDWDDLCVRTVERLAMREECVWGSLWFSSLQASSTTLWPELVPRLERALATSNIALATRLIARLDTGHNFAPPSEPWAARLVWCFACWIPHDGKYLSRVEESLKAFFRVRKSALSVPDRARLMAVEGVTLVHRERHDEADTCFAIAEELAAADAECGSLGAWCMYYRSRICAKTGRLDEALGLVQQASRRGHGPISDGERATFDMFEAWLMFLLKQPQAVEVLTRAKRFFERTDDYLRRGDVLSFRGRLALSDMDYRRARNFFKRALITYPRHDSGHPHVARTRVNMAMALLRCAQSGKVAGSGTLHRLQRALAELDRAERIYIAAGPDKHRLAKIQLTRAGVYHAVGEVERAKAEAECALEIACELGSGRLLGEAKRVQSELCQDPAERVELARQAEAYANETGDKRLQDKVEQSLGNTHGK